MWQGTSSTGKTEVRESRTRSRRCHRLLSLQAPLFASANGKEEARDGSRKPEDVPGETDKASFERKESVKITITTLGLAMTIAMGGCRPSPTAPVAEPPPVPRLVSLAPNLTEIAFAVGVGDRLVGRTTACDYPPEVNAIPVAGDFGSPSIEALLSLKPTAILYADLEDRTLPERLRSLGLNPVAVRCLTLDDIPKAMEIVAALAGREDQGRAVAARWRDTLQQERQRAAAYTNRPRVYVEYWGDPLYSAGRGSFVSELIGLAGGTNLGDEIESPYFQASPEWVLARDPQVILCLYHLTDGSAAERVRSRRAWQSIRAVRDGRVYDDFDVNQLLRPGPRVLDGLQQLRRRLHPE